MPGTILLQHLCALGHPAWAAVAASATLDLQQTFIYAAKLKENRVSFCFVLFFYTERGIEDENTDVLCLLLE